MTSDKTSRVSRRKAGLGDIVGLILLPIFWLLGPVLLMIEFLVMIWRNRAAWFSFRGRVNRRFYLTTFLIYAFYAVFAGGFLQGALEPEISGPDIRVLIVLLVGVPIAWSATAVAVKRLHDRGRSGWWLLVFYCAPVMLMTALASVESHPYFQARFAAATTFFKAMAVLLAIPVLSIWAIVELVCRRGTAGPNAYGDEVPVAVRKPKRAAPASQSPARASTR